MGKKNDITPPSNIKDEDLYDQEIIQGASINKPECGGENLGMITSYFISKVVRAIYLLIGDVGWVYTCAMYEQEIPSGLVFEKKSTAEQVVELIDNPILFAKYYEKAKGLGEKWLADEKNTKTYEGFNEVFPIRTSEVRTKYPAIYDAVKELVTEIYLAKSNNKWVMMFKQGIGTNAHEFVTRNAELFENKDKAWTLKLSQAHSLHDAIVIATLAIATGAKYFSYPDTNFYFIYPLRYLLIEYQIWLKQRLANSFPVTTNLERILATFSYKLPTPINNDKKITTVQSKQSELLIETGNIPEKSLNTPKQSLAEQSDKTPQVDNGDYTKQGDVPRKKLSVLVNGAKSTLFPIKQRKSEVPSPKSSSFTGQTLEEAIEHIKFIQSSLRLAAEKMKINDFLLLVMLLLAHSNKLGLKKETSDISLEQYSEFKKIVDGLGNSDNIQETTSQIIDGQQQTLQSPFTP